MERISQLKILKGIPFEKDTNTILTFDSFTEQQTFFSSKAIKSFTNLSFVKGFLYKKVKVEVDIEDVYNANYLMWKNNDGKWFYAFITDFEYVSDNCVEISFEIDWWQSYMHDIVFLNSSIFREHTKDDSIENQNNTKIDPDIPECEYIINKSDIYNITSWKVAIFYKPNLFIEGIKNGIVNFTKSDTAGQIGASDDNVQYKSADLYSGVSIANYNKVFSGSHILTKNVANETDISDLISTLSLLETTGYNIIDVVMIPKNFDIDDGGSREATLELQMPNPYYTTDKEIATYTPVNNKCFLYPYVKLVVSNFQGTQKEYRYERFFGRRAGTTSHNLLFRIIESIYGNYTMTMIPLGYKDVEHQGQTMGDTDRTSFDYGISTKVAPSCIWTENSAIRNIVQLAGGTALAIGGAMTGINALTTAGFSQGLTASGKMLQGDSNTEQGNATTSLIQILSDTYGFQFRQMTYGIENIREVDDYFTKYGYYFDYDYRPNVLGRTRFNYVKTNNARITGDIPIECRKYCIDSLNKGITFWHDKTNFEYSTSNAIRNKDLTTRGTIF